MRKLLILFLVITTLVSFGVAFSEKPADGDGSTSPAGNAPCDSGNGHPFANFTKQGRADQKCPANADADDGQDGGATDTEADAEADADDREGTPPEPERCVGSTGDPGLLGPDTIAEQIWSSDGSLMSPVVEDPERNGSVSGPLGEAFQPPLGPLAPLEPVGDEIACLIDLPVDEVTPGLIDL